MNDIWFNPSLELERITRQAAAQNTAFDETFSPEIRPADPRFGDIQANGVLPYAKSKRLNPRQTAESLIATLKDGKYLDESLIRISIAGPGFINFTFTPLFLFQWMKQFRNEEDFKKASGNIYDGKRMVIDFSAPNTAKQMHVGHIRSTVIGEAISRLLEFCGADLIRDNHLGDWGTQFGMLMLAIKRCNYDLDHPGEDPVEDLEDLYRSGHEMTIKDSESLEEARAELVKLQSGNQENMQLWKRICELSYEPCEAIYQQLGIRFDVVLGESFYRDKLDRIYQELMDTGIGEESQGALVVFNRDNKQFAQQPFLFRKSDGASNYATTDLATILYRVEEFKSEEVIYVTDARQADHFQQLFITVRKWFEKKGYPIPEMKHVTFGTILGEDGKAIKTRSGGQIKLKDLLNEAVDRAYAVVNEKNPDLSESERRNVAETVGLGAVRYADLMQNRNSDYIFSWNKMLSLEGNTAPYLLYAVARIHSIFRNQGVMPESIESTASPLDTKTEIALARKLVGFVDAINQVMADLRPHFLCNYLYELARAFSSFFDADRVLVEDAGIHSRRLMLCARTLEILETGLHLLGLKTLERM